MKISKIKKGLVLVSIASGVLALGCELIVDFDRTQIKVDATDATTTDATTVVEASTPAETSVPDATPDATPVDDAGSDADADADQ